MEAKGTATSTPVRLEAADRLFVSRGSLVVNRPEPSLETWELALALDGTETVHVAFPGAAHAGRILGAAWFAGERRWVAKGDGEFRAPTHLFRVGDDGSFTSLAEELLVGPLEPTQRDGLVAVATSDGRIVAIDTGTARIDTLLPAGSRRLAAIARGDGEVVVLTLEPGDPDARLVFHCGR